jgi:formate dehydrogenase major subunit
VPGLGTSYGRGGATTFASDLRHSDSILIMGSNMAECHPVAFRWVIQARTRMEDPCKVIHADPRFTRTSAMCDIYAPVRAGSDICFLGALIRHVLAEHERILTKPADQRDPRERFFHDYLLHYTNAATLINEEYTDVGDAGVFAGFKAAERRYDVTKWRYAAGGAPRRLQDRTMRERLCVFQILRRHFDRYTPKMVEDVCGTPQAVFEQVATALLANAGPNRTGAICYAVGWTQHTVGVQMIRAAAILQLLLGNIGRPGGGILALRGHATIQGSTDIATLYNLHPGYLNTPDARKNHDTLADYLATETQPTSWWSNLPQYMISQLKAWYGEAATRRNNFGYDWLPKIVGDHSHIPMFVAMSDGLMDGFFAMGQNPAVGGQNASMQRKALAKLKWLVVRDLYETETASFWKDSPEVKNGQLQTADIQTEVFFLPAAAVAEGDGSFTNTQRLVQWHDKAVDPPGDARTDIWFTVHLGLELKKLYRDSTLDRDQPIKALKWDYVDEQLNAEWDIKNEPSAQLILKEINGYNVHTGQPLSSFTELQRNGSTACGAWIYTGVMAGGTNRAAQRTGDSWVSPEWGFSWPANRRILYNRASADPQGQPWPKEQRLARQYSRRHRGYVYWDAAANRWVGLDVPDFLVTKAPQTLGDPNGVGIARHDGASPFIMKTDGKAWLYVPTGLVDGPLPAHYEPYESPVANLVYLTRQSNPVALIWPEKNRYSTFPSTEYPHILSTYRLTEHHLSGTMSRWLPWLVELQPELFCEISPEHAKEIGVNNTDKVSISTPRGTIQAKALVTRRIRPFKLRDRTVHHVGLPWHWGYKGLTTGDVVNDLTALVGDPNVTIHEAKVFVCQVRKV